jgi:integrase
MWWVVSMPLTNLQIKNAKPGMHRDTDGLYLAAKDSGAKSWIFRFQLQGKRREMGLGALHALSPVDARAEAARLRALVANGVDPIAQRNADRHAAAASEKLSEAERLRLERTFRVAADRHIASNEAGWRNFKHRQQWSSTLTTYAFPLIGDLPVDEVTTAHVAEVLQPIWTVKPETASRVRMRIEAVLNRAKALGWRSGENPAIWKGNLDAVLPRTSKVRGVRHHPAMAWSDASAFMGKLRQRDGAGARALEFAILTAARSGEVRGARWAEVDLANRLWVIPAERMKGGRDHRVPLSEAAVAVLEGMPRIAGCPLIFPGMRNQPLSDMSLSAVLKRLDLAQYTVHGFRSTFRDWAAEHGNAFEVCEAALSHKIGLKEVAAYLRTDHLDTRKTLMAAWAAFLEADVP